MNNQFETRLSWTRRQVLRRAAGAGSVVGLLGAACATGSSQVPQRPAELSGTIERFRAEELEHRDIGLEHEAELAPAYRLLSAAIRLGCKVAIRISERV